jgi:hypothetical protein
MYPRFACGFQNFVGLRFNDKFIQARSEGTQHHKYDNIHNLGEAKQNTKKTRLELWTSQAYYLKL